MGNTVVNTQKRITDTKECSAHTLSAEQEIKTNVEHLPRM
jgi:hypothetical protein